MWRIQMMKQVILLVMIGTVTHCHSVREIEGQVNIMVRGNIGESITLSIPFDKCYKVEAELKDNQKFIDFKPTRVDLHQIKNYSLQSLPWISTVFEDLRSSAYLKHHFLLVFEDEIMIFTRPNVVLIIYQSENSFIIKNRYLLPHIDTFDQLNLYKMGSKGILTIFNKTQIYQLGSLNYNIYTLPQPSAIIHLQQSPTSGYFFVIQFMKGLSIYKLSKKDKKVHFMKRYEGTSVGLSAHFTYITDISTKFYRSEGLLYVLDSQIGLVQLNMSQLTPKAKLVISHKRCQSFDSRQKLHFVLLCQFQGTTVVVRANREYNVKLKQMNYHQLQPIFLTSYLSHIRVTQQYYLIYSPKKINIVWNTQRVKLPQFQGTINEINVPQLQSLSQQNGEEYLYTIEGGILFKYQIKVYKARLVLKSNFPIIKVFNMYLYGNCAQLQMKQIQSGGVGTCVVQNRILLKVTQQGDGVQEFSINASIIVILITVFLLTIWICLKKYKGLQREARRVMENYQKSKMKGQKCKV